MKHFKILKNFKNRASNEEILENINDGLSLDISNFAILICAILIASIGLNMNAIAIIIGAMLISPLMGPIIGVGYGIGTYNLKYIKKAFSLLGIEILISIITATIYFKLTPITGASSEMIARTTPTIFDVLIAFIGGTAGIIGISRKKPGNVIPGVAIATALMPPLCTAGYGLSILNLKIFLGAGYLFLINSFFIALSTFLVVKALNLPKKTFIDETREKHIKKIIIIATILVIIPSMISAANMVNQTINASNLNRFINTEISSNSYVLSKNIDNTKDEIDLVIVGQSLTKSNLESLDSKLPDYGFKGYKLKVTQDETLDLETYFEKIQNKDNGLLKDLETTKDDGQNNGKQDISATFKDVGQELKALYPSITNVIIGNGEDVLNDKQETTDQSVLFAYVTSNKDENLIKNKTNLEKYLTERTGYKNVLLTIK